MTRLTVTQCAHKNCINKTLCVPMESYPLCHHMCFNLYCCMTKKFDFTNVLRNLSFGQSKKIIFVKSQLNTEEWCILSTKDLSITCTTILGILKTSTW